MRDVFRRLITSHLDKTSHLSDKLDVSPISRNRNPHLFWTLFEEKQVLQDCRFCNDVGECWWDDCEACDCQDEDGGKINYNIIFSNENFFAFQSVSTLLFGICSI